MRGALRIVLVVAVSALSGWMEGWAQTLPPVAVQGAVDAPAVSVPAAPQAGSSSSRLGNWFRENVSVAAGVKVWLAKWQVPLDANGVVQTSTSDWTPMVGPTITASARLREGEWLNSAFANFTWLQSGGFEFDPLVSINNSPPSFNQANLDAKRRDYTLSAGVTIWRGLGIFAGYYNTQQRLAQSGDRRPGDPPGAPIAFSDNQDFRIRGPIIGVFGSSSLSERIGLYGNAAFGILNYQTSTSFTASGTQAWATEFGMNITGPDVWKFATAFQIGFRAQVISINAPNSNPQLTVPGDRHRNDITWGPTFAFMGTF